MVNINHGIDLGHIINFFTFVLVGVFLRHTLEVFRAYTPQFLPELWDWIVWNSKQVGLIWRGWWSRLHVLHWFLHSPVLKHQIKWELNSKTKSRGVNHGWFKSIRMVCYLCYIRGSFKRYYTNYENTYATIFSSVVGLDRVEFEAHPYYIRLGPTDDKSVNVNGMIGLNNKVIGNRVKSNYDV